MFLPRASIPVTPGNVSSHYFADRDVLTQNILDMPGTSPSAHNRVPQPLVNKAGYPRQVTGNKYPKLREGKSSTFFFFFLIFRFQLPTATRCQCDQTFGRWNYGDVPSRWQRVFQELLCLLHLLCRLAHCSENVQL